MTWRLERLEAWARANGESTAAEPAALWHAIETGEPLPPGVRRITAAEFRRLLAEMDPELEDDG